MDSSGDIGVATGERSENDAKREALTRCANWGAKNCKFALAYSNQCVVIVKPMLGGEIVAGTPIVQSGPSIEAASRLATDACVKKNGAEECKVIYSNCTEPVLEY
jgi:hypothetical protein